MNRTNGVTLEEVTKVLTKASKSDTLPTDVLGSYTGESHDGGRPVQDADDL